MGRLGPAKGTVRRFARAITVDELLTNDGTGRRRSLFEEFKALAVSPDVARIALVESGSLQVSR